MAAHRFVSPTAIAELHLGLGDRERALDSLERAAGIHSLDLVWLHIRPYFAPLRGEPRFDALVRRIGTAEAAHSEAKTISGSSASG